MPKKIIEREIIDEDTDLSGSEHSITNTEPTPPPTNKKGLKNKEENINKTEMNKKLRTINATKARVENKREKDIQLEVDKRLQKQKEKEEEKQKLKQSFENEVEAVINKIISRNKSIEDQSEKPEPKTPKPKPEPKTPKPKPEPKPKPKYEEDINPYRLYKNLFM